MSLESDAVERLRKALVGDTVFMSDISLTVKYVSTLQAENAGLKADLKEKTRLAKPKERAL